MTSVKELQALNQEMAALARAGIPLELGLSRLGRTLPRKLGALSGRIAARLQEGRSLIEALQLEGRSVSGSYAAVVEAALETNRLPEALDALVVHGAAVQDLRRRLALALLYPCLVLLVAYGLFWLFLLRITPTVIATLEMSPQQAGFALRLLQSAWEVAQRWQWLAPVGFVLLLLLLLRVLAEATNVIATSGGFFSGSWFPGVSKVYANLDRAHVAGLLGLLVEHGVPLPRALRFAGLASQSARLRDSLEQLASGCTQGQSLSSLVHQDARLPTLMAHLFVAGETEGRLADALSQAATIYHRRAEWQANWLRTVFTPVLVAVVGGGITFLYAVTLFLPLRELLLGL